MECKFEIFWTVVQIECESDSMCEPTLRKEHQFGENVKMVLVRPVNEGKGWGIFTDFPSTFPEDYSR